MTRAERITAKHLASLHPRIRPQAQQFMERMAARGTPVALVQGARTPAEQLLLWSKGRDLIDGKWVITDPSRIVTKARTVTSSAHGYALAFDWAFLLKGDLVGPRPGKGNDSWDPDLPWKEGARVAIELGLVSGAAFGESAPGALDGWDLGHVELADWRTLARNGVVKLAGEARVR
jgi:hypothetical protein